MVSTRHDQKVCSTCGIAKPVTEYRLRAKDSAKRFGQCRPCHNAAERIRRHKKNAATNRRHMDRYLTQLKKQDSDAEVRRVCQAMLAYFGGIKCFVEEWVDLYEEARQERSPTAVKFLEAIVRLVQCNRTQKGAASALSPEQLQQRYSDFIKSLLRENPQTVANAASEAGWKLTHVS